MSAPRGCCLCPAPAEAWYIERPPGGTRLRLYPLCGADVNRRLASRAELQRVAARAREAWEPAPAVEVWRWPEVGVPPAGLGWWLLEGGD